LVPDGGVYVPPPDWTFEAGAHCIRSSDLGPCVNGDPVYRWQTSADHARYLERGGEPQRPIYRTGGVNGHPYVDFDGTPRVLHNDAWNESVWDATYFFVVHPAVDTDKGILLNYYPKPSVRTALTDANPTHTGVLADVVANPHWDTVYAPQLITWQPVLSNSHYHLYLNDGAQSAMPMTDPGTVARISVGADEINNNGYLTARVYELRRYPGVLTNPQRLQVAEELRVKYSLW
jgi:hypothetical protein